ncbi:hypothetical protein AV530_012639 [Patagioenas fasciata monilis]|uniref:Uncharacterized protein n=1 Tax=Patagioenas fasciata monilis TaxID=372326 RepID=A0A1V4JBR7_PATFA|nr:hypothetical protein AV530_012639 [Patagioenas fasciata monilis]
MGSAGNSFVQKKYKKTRDIPAFDILLRVIVGSLLQSKQNTAFQVGFAAATSAGISLLFISKQVLYEILTTATREVSQ